MMNGMAISTEKEIRDEAGRLTDSSKLFGTPEFMKGRYMVRAAAAQGGIYGNSVQEALYVIYAFDAKKAPLDGVTGKYRLTFTPETLPPVNAFWSLTMYDRPKQFLVDNSIDRYLINSPMLWGLRKTTRERSSSTCSTKARVRSWNQTGFQPRAMASMPS